MYNNIWNDIILLNLKDFENIGIDFYINIFLFGLAFCICIFSVLFEINRGAISLALKQIIRHGAVGEQNAKTLSDLGLINNKLIKYSLTRKTSLSRMISRVGAPYFTYEEYMKLPPSEKKKIGKFDIASAQFFIQESEVDNANKIYKSYSFSLGRVILFCLLVLLLYALLTVFSYEIICLINSALGKA